MQKPKLRIIIFSNSFDPISNLHVHIAQEAANLIDADIIYFLPSYYGDYGTFHHASDQERLHMVRMAIPNFFKPKYIVSNYELTQKEQSSPYDTLEYFAHLYPEAELFLLIDVQSLRTFSELFQIAKIKAMAQIICYKATDDDRPNIPGWNDHPIMYLNSDVYSLHVEPIHLDPKIDQLHPKVLEYMNQYASYAKARLKKMVSPHRYNHSLSVAETASIITQWYNQFNNEFDPIEKQKFLADAYLAGVYHDLCKDLPPNKLIEIARNNLKIKWWPSHKVLHGPVGAWWMKNKYFINNSRILKAVAEHTIPLSNNPDLLSKIIYLADRLEKSRIDFWGQEKYDYFWNLIKNNQLNTCFFEIYQATTALHEKADKKFEFPSKF